MKSKVFELAVTVCVSFWAGMFCLWMFENPTYLRALLLEMTAISGVGILIWGIVMLWRSESARQSAGVKFGTAIAGIPILVTIALSVIFHMK